MADESTTDNSNSAFESPHPGAKNMPRWQTGELIDAPKFTPRHWFAMLGPGLMMSGAAIGGGEWLVGPIVTSKYGGGLLWLATLSILGQLVYNIEISRYTLYSGEPIFTGKLRTLPGPLFWLLLYVILDFGAVFPYLAANAATPLATVILGEVPNVATGTATFAGIEMSHKTMLRVFGYAIFLTAMIPLIFGGKIYTALKALMTFKIVVVLGFLLILAVFASTWETWGEIGSGFFKFGNVPVRSADDPDGANRVVNIFTSPQLAEIDWSQMAILSALVAISGLGGLSNMPVSNYTRDQGWGMGRHIGAIPSMVGGGKIKLSHVGAVFDPNEKTMPRWRRWFRHVLRDQVVIWMPACFLGLALPCMLSVQFLPRGTEVDNWTASAMTAGAVQNQIGGIAGSFCWFMILFCGFLVLAPSMAVAADGVIRRWVDAFWTSSARLRRMPAKNIRYVYFSVLVVYIIFGVTMLSLEQQPTILLTIATTLFNFALGFSCWHALAVNVVLLPRELRPNWFMRIALALAGVFFWITGTLSAMSKLGVI